MMDENTNKLASLLGHPDLEIAGLQIWIQGRQFPDSSDYWDGNWLYCTLHCGSPDSDVWLKKDPFIHIPELQRFYNGLMDFSHTLSGSAHLETMEENLNVQFEAAGSQDIAMEVFITPSHSRVEEHRYSFSVTKVQVEDLLRQLNNLLRNYPVKGQP